MKVLLICASPRKGNTEYILNRVYDSLDCEKELVLLRNYHIENCTGCLLCHEKEKCHIKDDMSELIEKMIIADLIIFGIPNYFDNVTGLFKTFIDRCHPLYKSERLKGKDVRYIFIGGGSIEGTRKVMKEAVNGFNRYLGLNVIEEETFKALEKDELENKKAKYNLNL